MTTVYFFCDFFSFTSLLAAAIGWYANDVNTEINDILVTIDKKFDGRKKRMHFVILLWRDIIDMLIETSLPPVFVQSQIYENSEVGWLEVLLTGVNVPVSKKQLYIWTQERLGMIPMYFF